MQRSSVLFQPNPWECPTYSIGLDPSITSFGVYCQPINHEEWYGFTVETEPKDGTDTSRIQAIAKEVIEILGDLPHPVSVFTFEDYGPVNARAGKITARAELCGILKWYVLQSIAAPVITIPPPALKQFATGKGNAKKDAVMQAAAAEGFFARCSDEADAYFAARLGQRIILGDRVGVNYIRVNP